MCDDQIGTEMEPKLKCPRGYPGDGVLLTEQAAFQKAENRPAPRDETKDSCEYSGKEVDENSMVDAWAVSGLCRPGELPSPMVDNWRFQ